MLRPLGGRRFGGRGGADPRGHRRRAHLRLRRPRPDAAGRERPDRLAVPRPLQHPARPRGRQRDLPGVAARDPRPGGEAQDHWPALRRDFRGRGQEARQGRSRPAGVPGAGHALPRCDRERLVLGRPIGDDQVAPQRRWPARAHEHETRRAAARTLQGRGPRARPRARPARGLRRPPPLPRPRPGDPLPPAP